MSLLPTLFPLLVVLATLVLGIFVIRLDQKLSRGSQSAGPRETIRPKQVGLQQTPWELRAIDDQLRAASNRQARADLTNTINRLSKAAGIDDPAFMLTHEANDNMISGVIATLEERLDLPPLTAQHGLDHGSSGLQTPSPQTAAPAGSPPRPDGPPPEHGPPNRLGSALQ